MDPEKDALFAAIEEEIAAERGPRAWLRQRPTWQRVLVVLLVAAGIPLLVLALRSRADLPVYPRFRLALELAALGLVALPALWLALRPLHRPALSQRSPFIVMAIAVAVALIIAALPEAHFIHPSSLQGTGDDFLAKALGCLAFGAVAGAPVVGIIWAVERSPLMRITGLAAGGMVGDIALQLHCPMVSPSHLLAGHFSVPLAFALIATVLFWRRLAE